MSLASISNSLLATLFRSNLGILQQKLGLLQALEHKHGIQKARAIFPAICPIVHASIGQHMRHSLDHIERAAAVAAMEARHPREHGQQATQRQNEIHYDWRERGGLDEQDMEMATDRINRIQTRFEDLHCRITSASMSNDSAISNPQDSLAISALEMHVANAPVSACFMLTGDSQHEFALPSTLARELGFAVHHAIHHMAFIRIIATSPKSGLTDADLPHDFGRAPSTVNYDRIVSSS